jgi:hypothetical protein
MNSRIVFKILLALVLVGAIIGLAVFAYNAGVAQGFALNTQSTAGEPLPPPLPYNPMFYGPHFYGFGFLGCLVPFFLIFLIFFAMRGLFWGGYRPWGHMHHGPWGRGEPGQGVPSIFDEWHRQAHSQPPTDSNET